MDRVSEKPSRDQLRTLSDAELDHVTGGLYWKISGSIGFGGIHIDSITVGQGIGFFQTVEYTWTP